MKIKPYVCMIQCLLGIVTNCLCFLLQFNFYFSMTMLFLTYLLSEGWMSPAVAMIQLTIDVRYKGVAMGVFLFATAIFGTIGSLVIGTIIDDFHIQSQEYKGYLLAVNTALPCAIGAFFFWISSIHYEKFRRQIEDEKIEAQTKASNFNWDDAQSVSNYGHFKPKFSDDNRGGGSIDYLFEARTEFTVIRAAAGSV